MKKALAWTIDPVAGPAPLAPGTVDLEKHLEDWIDADISIVADDVLLIGRQVYTAYNTAIDLLGLDGDGNLVVIELKRDQTLRDTVAQGLEYAEWCSRLDAEAIRELAEKRFDNAQDFEHRFTAKFQAPFPETLNAMQRVLVVAPEITDRTERLVTYLYSRLSVPINAVSFDVFQLDGRLVLVRHTTIDEDVAPIAPTASGSSQKHRTLEEFRAAAAENGVGAIFESLLAMNDILPASERFWQSFALKGKRADGRFRAGFTIYPTSETNPGTCDVVLYPGSLGPLYGVAAEGISDFFQTLQLRLTAPSKDWGGGIRVSLGSIEQAAQFERLFREFAAGSTAKAATGGEDL